MPHLKLRNIQVILPNFQNRVGCEKYLKDDKHNILAQIYAWIFCTWILSVPQSSLFFLSYAL